MAIGCKIVSKVPKRDQKIIIFDSPDGTGKTEISRALSKELKIPYFRMGSQHDNWRKGRFKEALEFDQTYLVEFLKQTKYDVIIDRAYPSEWVYSFVYNRETNLKVLEQVDREFARLGAYIVIPLRRDYRNSRPDEVVKESELSMLHTRYLDFRKWTRCSTITMIVDDFNNDIDKQLPLLLGEFNWGEFLNVATDVTLERPKNQKDNSELFKGTDLAWKTTDLKGF